MKRKIQLILSLCLLAGGVSFAQNCPTAPTVGSSSNSLTNVLQRTNSVAVDKDLNSVVFIHRNNTAVYGGDSGELRYDISTDGGNSWSSNLGVLNPSNGTTIPARYPQVSLYNPAGNTNPNNAYLSYIAPNFDSNGSWSGAVNGVRKLNGTGNTENYNQAGLTTYIPSSMIEGAPGVFWSIVPSYTGIDYNGGKVSNIKILKGTWNNSTQDVQWSTNNVITPNLDTTYSSGLTDYHISFSPSGQIGWIALSASMAGITAPDQQFPVFYRTLNGGATWTGPFITNITDQNQFPCISSWSGSSIYTGDLTVDVNGAPHFLTSIGGSTLFDITVTPNTVNNANTITFQIFGISVTHDGILSITRTADGSKIFYCWVNRDASWYNTNPEITNFSNLYSKALDVSTMIWTPTKNFTSCNTETNGKIFFPKTASEVLQPSPGIYKLAVIYTNLDNNFDLYQPVDFKFLNGVEWHNSDFTVPHVTANPVITATASSTNVCEGTPLTLTATGNAPIIEWSSNFSANIVNGVPFFPNTILPTFTATGDAFSVIAMNALGCIAYEQINVSFIPSPSISLTASNSAICAGLSQTLSASSPGNTISWSPGNIAVASITVSPNTSTSYTATATSPNGCTSTATTLVTVNPIPTVTAVASSNSVCAGGSLTLTGAGTAQVYTWNNGVTNAQAFQPNATNTYTLTGTNTTTNCSNTSNVSVVVNPLPTVITNSSETVFCLDASGPALAALPFGGTWIGAGINNNAFSPLSAGAGEHSITYSYTDNNGCTNTSGINMTVHALPNVTINTSGENICSGGSVTLSGAGASSYEWTNGVIDGETFVPSSTNNYSVSGTDLNGCENSANVLITVNTTPVVTNQSPNQTATIGTDISFFVQAAQTIDTYQWQTNIGFGWQNLNDFGQYSGSSSNLLTISSVTNSNNNQPFRCIITLGDCSDTSAIAVLNTTDVGIDAINGSNSDLNFGVYPNPFTEQTKVVFEQVQDQTEITILDARGLLVKRLSFSGKHLVIDREDLANGVYFIHVNGNKQNRQTKKLVLI